MKQKFKSLFPTLISTGQLAGASTLNKKLLADIRTIPKQDKMGQKWSKENYVGGYTSYGSLSDLHHRTPAFMEFQEKLQPYAEAFAKGQGWNLKGSKLEMTALFMNVMNKGTHHSLHNHPQSVISGVYYIETPPGSSPLKIEDPRLAFYMNAPLCGEHYHIVPAKASHFVMFESWVRHEVPPNQSKKPRICISFNYDLVPDEDC